MEFRKVWGDLKAAAAQPAAAVRWAVQAHPAYGFKLCLQGLPKTASSLRKDSRLSADNAATIQLASWVAPSTMAEGGPLSGPVPLLFAANAAQTREHLAGHPERLYRGRSSHKRQPELGSESGLSHKTGNYFNKHGGGGGNEKFSPSKI